MQNIARLTDDSCCLVVDAHGFSAQLRVKEIAHCWDALSHYPERRARLELAWLEGRLNDFAEHVERLKGAGGDVGSDELARFAERHISATRAYWHAESRCLSAFIVGPARFPTSRNQKRQASSDKARENVTSHLAAAKKALERRAFPHGRPDGPIRASNPDAPELLRREIAKREQRQELMKDANSALRKAKTSDEDELAQIVSDATGLGLGTARKVVMRNCFGSRGFEGFELNNNRAEIRRLQQRLARIEATRERGSTEESAETQEGEVRVVENVDADRIQLYFPGKPSADTRAALKSLGFRWSPRHGAWQRHLNNAGREAARHAMQKLHAAA